MIPIKLALSGFLSYRDPVELDFTTFDLACIAGPNGAGKSSLLDAITWVLFGQARKRDDSLINAQCDAAEVSLVFAYEDNLYRVQRTKPRDKTALLEFHILQEETKSKSKRELANRTRIERKRDESPIAISNPGTWKPLTERTLRETEAIIERTLRLDYETFVNASFFLQGKADLFTQQRPGDRKRILGGILGLEIWENYRQRAAERRRRVETDISVRDGQLQEITAELAEEQNRRTRLKELQSNLERLSEARAAQESALENLRKIAASLAEQGKLVDTLARQLEATNRHLEEVGARLAARQEEKESFAQTLSQAEEIETIYRSWEATRAELERWEAVSARFREHEKRRQEPLEEINAARARLAQEQQGLLDQQKQAEATQLEFKNLKSQIRSLQGSIKEGEDQLARRAELEGELAGAHQRLADARAENPRLKAGMDELKARIDQLAETEGAACPVCGQPLSLEDRQRLIADLAAQGKEMGDRYRANKALLDQAGQLVSQLEAQIAGLSQAEKDLRGHLQALAQLTSRLEVIENQRAAWESQGAPRLAELQQVLESETFAPEARGRLAEVDAELKSIGYDAAAHDAARRAEVEGRAAEAGLRALERARATLAPLDREIAELQTQIGAQQAEVARQQKEHEDASAALVAAQAQLPDLNAAERDLLDLQERENRLRLEVGAAQQKVLVLDDLKARRQILESERQNLASQVGQYKQLERAFGKDGIPALLIEQALPQIEAKANEILDRLSMGSMSVCFITQAAFKDRRRDDLRETLDIQISDSAGPRDYEMFSGGESFRVNFAIRLALSEVLAQRAGARLQTLVVDEGFGSQDALGRQRLIEAISLIRQDFAKILVITHIDELKEAFPVRIEVEKTPRGSTLHVI